jgi:hypothetical protein
MTYLESLSSLIGDARPLSKDDILKFLENAEKKSLEPPGKHFLIVTQSGKKIMESHAFIVDEDHGFLVDNFGAEPPCN